MTERSMTQEAMLASLQDIRLPSEAAGGVAADLAVAIGLAALLAFIVLAVLRALGLRRSVARDPDLSERAAEVSALPDDLRRVALLHLLKRHAPSRYRALTEDGALYRRTGLPLHTIEAEVRRLV